MGVIQNSISDALDTTARTVGKFAENMQTENRAKLEAKTNEENTRAEVASRDAQWELDKQKLEDMNREYETRDKNWKSQENAINEEFNNQKGSLNAIYRAKPSKTDKRWVGQYRTALNDLAKKQGIDLSKQDIDIGDYTQKNQEAIKESMVTNGAHGQSLNAFRNSLSKYNQAQLQRDNKILEIQKTRNDFKYQMNALKNKNDMWKRETVIPGRNIETGKKEPMLHYENGQERTAMLNNLGMYHDKANNRAGLLGDLKNSKHERLGDIFNGYDKGTTESLREEFMNELMGTGKIESNEGDLRNLVASYDNYNDKNYPDELIKENKFKEILKKQNISPEKFKKEYNERISTKDKRNYVNRLILNSSWISNEDYEQNLQDEQVNNAYMEQVFGRSGNNNRNGE